MKKFSLGVITGLLIGLLAFTTFAVAGDNIKLIINGKEIQCDVAPQVINGRTMVPARFVAENLGASATWDAGQNAVVITSNGGGVPTDLTVKKSTTTNKGPINNGYVSLVSMSETTYTEPADDNRIKEGFHKASVTITLKNSYKTELQLPGIKAVFSDGKHYSYRIESASNPEVAKHLYIPSGSMVSLVAISYLPYSVTVTDWKVAIY
ncbi:MAG: copper amine oxidase N-terminal domain-containing protein [Syntrophomonadaceae bacterium]